jgi:hypothetical protein
VKEVWHELGVRYVLEGSLRKAGNRIRHRATSGGSKDRGRLFDSQQLALREGVGGSKRGMYCTNC